jgi:hypothetical protein
MLRSIEAAAGTSHTTDINAIADGLDATSLAILKELCDVQSAEEVHGIGVATDQVIADYLQNMAVWEDKSGAARLADVTARRATLDGLRS